MNFKQSIIGGSIVFLLATSCCWLPAFIIGIGGASGLLAFANGLEQFSGMATNTEEATSDFWSKKPEKLFYEGTLVISSKEGA